MGSLLTKKKKGPTKSRVSAAKHLPHGRVTPAAPQGVPYQFEKGISFPRSAPRPAAARPRDPSDRPDAMMRDIRVMNFSTGIVNDGMNLDIDGVEIIDCDNGYVQKRGSTNAKNLRITDTRG
jgi:hypothetical protein